MAINRIDNATGESASAVIQTEAVVSQAKIIDGWDTDHVLRIYSGKDEDEEDDDEVGSDIDELDEDDLDEDDDEEEDDDEQEEDED